MFKTAEDPGRREWIRVRGIYGGVPTQLLASGRTLRECGVNAIWIGSGGLKREDVARLKNEGCRVFAEFNTMHEAGYLREHPDAAPIGADGKVSPPPDGWQGVCPSHPGYRDYRMSAFRAALREFEIDGIWLDYHHSHASWEQAEPAMPDSCFCSHCLAGFEKETGRSLQGRRGADAARLLLGDLRAQWIEWRCALFTAWVREVAAIRREVRPAALLGTFHCPWSDKDRGGALRDRLAIDLRAQARLVDVLSPMPYHARFGHSTDPAWISRQLAWLGDHLQIRGRTGERPQIWPIVQLSDWGEKVPASQVATVMDHGTRRPAAGVMVFNWGGLTRQMANVEEMIRFYRSIQGS